MANEDSLRYEVQRFCATIGRDRLFVQAAGGNVSWKTPDTLWIKASGTWLADAERKNIFVPIERGHLDVAIARGDFVARIESPNGYALRPSIETLLHVLLPHKIVLHLHPVDAVAHLVRVNCEDSLEAALGTDFAWELVDYFKPGADLARALHAKLFEKPDAQVIFLKNHGVILSAETIVEIERLLRSVTGRLAIQPRKLIDPQVKDDPAFFSAVLNNIGYRLSADRSVDCLATNFELSERLASAWAICPDHVVFLGATGIRLRTLAELPDVLKSLRFTPPFVFVSGLGVLEKNEVSPAERAQLLFYLDVMLRQPDAQSLVTLSTDQIASLLNWDAEKYRQSLNGV